MAAGANDTSYTATYTITQTDIDAGVVYNLATVNAVTDLGTNVTATSTDPTPCTTCPVDPSCADCTITPINQTNRIALVKTAVIGGTGTGVLGEVITYTFAVTNTGNTTLTNVVLTDPMTGLVLSGSSIASLAPGATNTNITGTYVITQADVDAGKVTNTATVTAKAPQDKDVDATSGITVTFDATIPSIALVKTATVEGDGSVGKKITYTFAVTNTGTTTLKDIVVTDPMLGLTIPVNTITTLAPGATNISIKGTYVITAADVTAGKVTNSALVTAKDSQGNPVTDRSGTTITTDNDTETPVGQRSTIALVKKGVLEGTGVSGDTITYTFEVTNTGTTPLTDIVVTDPMIGLTITGSPIATLAPGDTESITGTYIITQADVDTGKVTNSAKVAAKDPDDKVVTDVSGTTIGTDDSTVTEVTQNPSIDLEKTAVISGTGVLGDTITYTFAVTNTGNTTLTNIVITDPMVGLTMPVNTITSLAPGATHATIKGTYKITQADVDAGKVVNTAKVIGKSLLGKEVNDASTATITTVSKSTSIAFVKTGEYKGDVTKAKVGDKIIYTFTVTNTGNVTVKDIKIKDDNLVPAEFAVNPATLAPGKSGVITKDYIVTQADIDAGQVTNTATATGKDPQGDDVTIESTEVTEVPKLASIAFVKTGEYKENPTRAKVGDKIIYTFKVTNTGNVTVNNIVIDDAKLGGTPLAINPATLAPAEIGEITKEYTITQADIDAGQVTNTATATGQNPDVTALSSTVTTLPKVASIDFVKTGEYKGDPTNAKVGDIITYTFTVTNTGNVMLKDIVINDAKLGTSNLALGVLAPLAERVITKDYAITQADIDLGKVINSAIATGKDPDNKEVTIEASAMTLVPRLPASIAFVKTGDYKGDATKAKVGDIITYTFTVTNTGNVTVSNIVIEDTKLGMIDLALVPGTLAPLAIGAITKDYLITQADIDAGEVINTAIAKGQDPQGAEVKDTSGTAVDNNDNTVTTLPVLPSLGFVKTGDYKGDATKAKVGDIITYTFTVTNTGNVTVSNIVIEDTKLGVIDLALVPGTLAPTETGVITKDYAITQADIDLGKVINKATAVGENPQEENITAESEATTALPESAKIALILKGTFQDENNDGQAQIGETILYSYTIINMGDVPLSNVWIEDAMVGLGMSNGTMNLPVGATDDTSFTASYSITQADIIAGYVINQATVFGASPLGNIVQDLSHDTSPLEDGSTTIGVNGCQLTIFNAVSPNLGSDYEKILYIRGLDCYPNNTVQIFDRWGVKVYDVDGYDNNAKAFRGISEGRVTISQSKGLPNGTYFYIINYVDKEGKGFNKSGYLHLIND